MSSPERLQNYRLLGSDRIFTEPSDATIQMGCLASNDRDISHTVYRGLSDQDRLELRLMRDLLLDVFTDDESDTPVHPKNLSDILPLYRNNSNMKMKANERIGRLMISSYFSKDIFEKDYHSVLDAAFGRANEYIQLFEHDTKGMLHMYSTSLSINNEVQAINNPVDLLLIALSPKSSRKMRFEARRKLILTDLALRVLANSEEDQKHTEDIEEFMRFLNKKVWQGGSGLTIPVEIISSHSKTDYTCTGYSILDPLKGTVHDGFKDVELVRDPNLLMSAKASRNVLVNPCL